MPEGGGEGEEPCGDAYGDAGFGARFAAFEAERAFDDLAQGPCAGPWGLGLVGLACEASHDTRDHLAAAPLTLVVPVAVRQTGEPWTQMCSRVAHELRPAVCL